MNERKISHHELAELAVEVEELGPLSPEWYLTNLISQIKVKLREWSGRGILSDEDRVVDVLNGEFIARGFRVRDEMIRALLHKPEPEAKLEELAILTGDCKWVLNNLRERLDNYNALLNFLKLLSWATSIKDRHPVEARWPVLKAVALLNREEQQRMAYILADTSAFLQSDPLINSILLMLMPDSTKIRKNWLRENAPLVMGRRIYQIACEIWHPGREGGGLKRVMRNHGKALKRLIGDDAELVHIEPYFPAGKNRDDKVVPVDWGKVMKDVREYTSFEVMVGNNPVEAVVYSGRTREMDIPVFLIRDRGGYYVNMLYYCGGEYVSWEDFSEFFSRAAWKLIVMEEEEASKRLGSDYKPPIVHTNEAQTALINILRFMDAHTSSSTPHLNWHEALFWFTTHTYGNRGVFSREEGERILTRWKVPDAMKWWFIRSGSIDVSSGGIRSADGVNGVSEIQVEEVQSYDEGVPIVSITNGDDRSYTAKDFRRFFSDSFPDTDVEFPEPWQIEIVKRIAKTRLGLNPYQPVISYSGRLVEEKAGRKRAFTDDNLEELVKMGAQVVIFGNVQPDEGSKRLYEGLKELQKRLETKKEYPGKLILVNKFTIEEQIALLAATDIQVQDSDRGTEAAGYTEADVSANGGLVLGPPYKEGIIQAQGEMLNFAIPGEGNTVIAANPKAESYLAVLKRLIEMNPSDLATYQATSVRLSRILDAELTAAEYLRQWDRALRREAGISIEDTRPINEEVQLREGESFVVTALVSLKEGVPLEEVLVQVWTNATRSGKWAPRDMHLREKKGDRYIYQRRVEPPGAGVFEYTLRASPDFGKTWLWAGKPGENRVIRVSEVSGGDEEGEEMRS